MKFYNINQSKGNVRYTTDAPNARGSKWILVKFPYFHIQYLNHIECTDTTHYSNHYNTMHNFHIFPGTIKWWFVSIRTQIWNSMHVCILDCLHDIQLQKFQFFLCVSNATCCLHTVSNQKYTEQKQNTYHNNFIVKKDSQLKICGRLALNLQPDVPHQI